MLRRLPPDDRAIPASLRERGRRQIDSPRPVGDHGVPPEALDVQRQQYAADSRRARGLDRDAVPAFDEQVRDLVERERIAARLSAARPAALPPLSVCVQVNISGEATKSGVAPGAALELCRTVSGLPGLRLRGLMGIADPDADGPAIRTQFRSLRLLFEAARADGLAVDTLSMGMSADFESAIAEGATMVRIGSAIFGPREERMAGEAT